MQEVHDPSVCRHMSDLQLEEQTWEQFVPKNPSLQAKDHNIYKQSITGM